MSTQNLMLSVALPCPRLPPPLPPLLRHLRPSDRAALQRWVSKEALFTPAETSVALELVDAALAEPSGEYRVTVAELDGRLAGYVCYGPTPMTESSWDLYW